MKTLSINGIRVTAPEDADLEELAAYVDQMREKYKTMRAMTVTFDGEYADIEIMSYKQPFERIRRITGYLVGALPRWNNAKHAEERDRVKHTLGV